ncbi:MAG TPA: DNA-binding domain-containing protein [Casimicrobiaceae bacterium]|nr:DNA-binding domain-containing protein [Casimicrobiaceae bacterium]
MCSLLERQRQFAAALRMPAVAGADNDPFDIYRRSVRRNYRNALGATYRTVKRLVGVAFFDTAVDAYVAANPSVSADLNGYGDRFDRFLATYPPAANLPYLADVARLEWAIDVVHRAADAPLAPHDVLAALAVVPATKLTRARLQIAAASALIQSSYPVVRIFETNGDDYVGDTRVSLDEGGVRLLVRRMGTDVVFEPLDEAGFTWMLSLATGQSLGDAVARAVSVDSQFDVASALRTHIAMSTIVGVEAK